MCLNLFDICKSRSKLGCHLNTVTCCTYMIGGNKSFKLWCILCNHLSICTETSCSKHYRLCIYNEDSVLIFRLYTCYLAVLICKDFGCFSLQQNRYAQFIKFRIKCLYKHRSYSGCITRSVYSLYTCTAELSHY